MIVTDWFAPEQAIIDRLRTGLGSDVLAVYGAADMETHTTATVPAPSVHVYFAGYTPAQTQADGHRTMIDQTWVATVATTHAREARQAAGELIARTAALIVGWSPAPGYRRFVFAQAALRARYAPGRALTPLAFTTRIVIQSEDS